MIGQSDKYSGQFSRLFPRLNHIYVKDEKISGCFAMAEDKEKPPFTSSIISISPSLSLGLLVCPAKVLGERITAISAQKGRPAGGEIITMSLYFIRLKI